jgi:MoxR-like ATPase
MTADELEQIFAITARVFLPRPVARYIARLVAATHPGAGEATEEVRQYVSYGASPRAAIAIAEASRANALLAGRPSVGFEDVRLVAPAALNHRVLLNYKARFDRISSFQLIDDLLERLDEAGLDLPGDIEVSRADG